MDRFIAVQFDIQFSLEHMVVYQPGIWRVKMYIQDTILETSPQAVILGVQPESLFDEPSFIGSVKIKDERSLPIYIPTMIWWRRTMPSIVT